MNISKLSGWFRIAIVASAGWILIALIYINPWYRMGSGYFGSRTSGITGHSNWDDFLLFGILPTVIFWGIIWIVQGFKKGKIKDEPSKNSQDDADNYKDHGLADDTGQGKRAEKLQENQSSEVDNETNKNPRSSDQIVEISPKKPTIISNILYYFVWITLLSFILVSITLPREVTKQDALYAPIWVGILSAWTAKRKGKSGLLWFFIGLLIGYSVIFLLIFSYPYLISR